MHDNNIGKLDRNLAVSPTIDAPDVRLFDVRKPPFRLYGLYNPTSEPHFQRLPTEVATATSAGVSRLQVCTAGGRVRFSTNSPYIVIKAIMPHPAVMPHMPLTGSSGFDLYIDSPDGEKSVFYATFVPPTDMTDGYESKHTFATPGTHFVTINFPLYDAVDALYIGIAEGSTLGAGAPYRDYPPVVYYGSSITQGGCASRPGNSYQAMIGRMLNLDHINLGFSGNGKGEDAIVNYMASLNMSAFVSDYDHNAPSVEHLRATHRKMYDTIRAAHPDIPYIMLSRPDFLRSLLPWGEITQTVERRRVVLETYHYAYEKGDRNVYFIDGSSLFRGPFEDSCTVDYAHPNDLGFSRMADAIGAVLKRADWEGKLGK